MKKLLMVGGAAAMAFLLSSCFVLQGVVLKNGALAPGKSTMLNITVRPASTEKTGFSKLYQFVLVGVDTPADATVGKATWGTNGAFGGPLNMPVSSALAGAIGTDCDNNGFAYSTLTGITWKGFVTSNPVADKQAVAKKAVVQVVVKTTPGATSGDNVSVIALTGAWVDDGDGILNAPDTFACTGNGTTPLFIK
jgi:hypothetical protein